MPRRAFQCVEKGHGAQPSRPKDSFHLCVLWSEFLPRETQEKHQEIEIMGKLRVKRKAHTRADGTRVKASTFLIKDRGAKGRTPESKRFFDPGVRTGWRKDLPAGIRRRRVLRAHKGNTLASARSMQSLANVTTDKRTKQLAGLDARFFFRQHKQF